VGGPPAPEKVYEHRHAQEIERAENIAAGLPPEGLPKETAEFHDGQPALSFSNIRCDRNRRSPKL
jgi:hypothetical protein